MSSLPVRIDSGTSMGSYVVERQLAQGGMSILYLARDSEDRRFVIKVLLPEAATNVTRARLMREARALAAVDHAGVVRVHGTGDHDGMPWIVMDFVQGTDLKRVLSERGPIPVGLALRYAMQSAEALVAAHDAGVIHRDLKPSNLLLTPDGRVVLVDFGIAKRRPDAREEDEATSPRQLMGTMAYLSPEQLEHGLADERSDVWSLGCVLYEMVLGVPPFGRGGPGTTAAILRDEPRFGTHLPLDFVNVVSACLRKSSFARVASARELLVMLREVIDEPSPALAVAPVGSSSTGASRPPAGTSVRPGATASAGTPSLRPVPSSPPSSTVPPARQSYRPRLWTTPPGPAILEPPRVPTSSSMRIAVARGRVKGTAVRAGIAWFARTHGNAALARIVERASPELRAILRPNDPALGLIASGWYGTPLIGELLGLVAQVAQPENPAVLAARMAEAVAKDNVGGVYRSLFRLVVSPQLLEANAQRVWRTYFDEGNLSIQLVGRHSFLAYVGGWSRHHSQVCAMFRPLLESLLRTVGYSDLAVQRMACVDRGNTQCMFEGAWSIEFAP